MFTTFHSVQMNSQDNKVQHTTSATLTDEDGFPSAGHSILWREFVAECAPESTAAFADKKTRYFPSGLRM